MLKTLIMKAAVIAFVGLVSFAAHAIADTQRFDVPAGDLIAALESFAKQADVDLVYQDEQVKGLRTGGVSGSFSPRDAVMKLLEGTPLLLRTDEASGALLITTPLPTGASSSTSATEENSPKAAARTDSAAVREKRSFWNRLRLAQAETNPSAQGVPSESRNSETDNSSRASAEAEKNGIVQLGEIVVTATKRAVTLKDVPIAVSVVTAEDIIERGFTKYDDYLNSLPGVYFADGGPTRSAIRIRGLSASEGGHATLVATYFGETPTSVQGTFPDLRLVDIEQVEVLRGPQGTLFGANALAGLVRVLPAPPDLENYQVAVGARGFSTAHSDDESYHVEGVVNLPLVENRFALRLVGYKDDIAGYIDNQFSGQPELDWSAAFGLPPGFLVIPAIAPFVRKDVNRQDTMGGRAAATWQATERLRFELGYVNQEVKFESEEYVTPSIGEYAHRRGLDAYSESEGREEVGIANLTVRYDWDTVSFTSASAFANFDQLNFVDQTETAILLFGVPIPVEETDSLESEAFTQELRMQSRGSGALQWLFGAFYLDRDRSVFQPIPDFSCPTCFPVLATGEDVFLTSRIGLTEEQRAVFGELAYDFSPRWTVSAGARWFEQDLHLRVTDIGGVLGATQLDTDNKSSTDEFNPAYHLRFRPSNDTTLYAQAAKGFRTGAPNNALPAQCQAEAQARGIKSITDPDTLWNYELGVKSSLAGGRLGLNAAVYHGDWSGIQLPANLACAFSATLNGGDATTRGVELELVAQPSSAWRFNLAASYNESEFDQVDPNSGFIDGERIPASPKTNGSAGVQYNFALGGEWSGFARADYQYVGDIRLIAAALVPRVITQDGYGTGSVRLSFSRDNLALEVFARNVTDERAILGTGHPVFGSDQFLVRPRELGVELRYRYE